MEYRRAGEAKLLVTRSYRSSPEPVETMATKLVITKDNDYRNARKYTRNEL